MVSIQETFDEFILDRQIYCAERTIRTYTEHLQSYFLWLEEHYGKSLDSLHYSDIPEKDNIIALYILHLRRQNSEIRNTTIRSYCRSIKAFLRFCYEKDYCKDYLKGLKLPKDDSTPKQPLCVDEVKQVDQCFDRTQEKGLRNYCIFHLMLDCGLRSQEVRQLQVEHLQPSRNILLIKDSKGKKSRFTLAPDFIFECITDYMTMTLRTSGIIFRGLRDNKPMTEETIKQLFQDLKKQSGVQRIHAHLCRHTFATSFLIGGGNLEFLRVFMGHYDYSVTQGYTQLAAQCKMLGLEVYQLDSIFFTRGY